MAKTRTRHIDRSVLVVDPEAPLDSLPYIADSLHGMGVLLQQEPGLSEFEGAERGAGLILDLLAYTLRDVQDALEARQVQQRAD